MSQENKNESGKELGKTKNKFCKRVTLVMFQLTCFGLAGYMVYVQLKTYCDNEDLSNIAYKHFQNEAQDVFPTFSICAVGGIWILKNDKMPTNHSVGPYYEILLGREDDSLNYSKILFHKVIIDVHKLILDFSTSIDNGTKIVRAKGSIHGKQNSNRSLEISHLDSQRICVTKEAFSRKQSGSTGVH